ncbi:MAG: hypothetical protein PSV16_14620 [Flavobacterium sp.]|nr:hypothetical protein [Flavobacterium sp.]
MTGTMHQKTTGQREESFQYWLMNMEDSISKFLSKFEKGTTILDYSIAPLDIIEKLILDSFDTIDEINRDKSFYDELARYTGETFRRRLGGNWKLDLDITSAYYNLPVLDYATPVCPHKLITACISRKEGSFLSDVLMGSIREELLRKQSERTSKTAA